MSDVLLFLLSFALLALLVRIRGNRRKERGSAKVPKLESIPLPAGEGQDPLGDYEELLVRKRERG